RFFSFSDIVGMQLHTTVNFTSTKRSRGILQNGGILVLVENCRTCHCLRQVLRIREGVCPSETQYICLGKLSRSYLIRSAPNRLEALLTKVVPPKRLK